ncbi:hypothetical protein QBC40DRAFT_73636 [Triangularia verruculosa]|uniref:Uncharacterized protein n=1 Tax=Triangularia verruculosa TaxID=2587418 RepID=A0AAN6XID1_9PEZI|nr:hypothetical protein QBC40DRAFT_73636 [Triangularia verruculosa]
MPRLVYCGTVVKTSSRAKKRKYNPGPPGPKHKRFSWRGEGPVPRPTPSEETQELYNLWQQAEREVNLEDLRRLNEPATFVGHEDFLSPSQATSRSRSASCTSTTQSVISGMSGVDLNRRGSKSKGRKRATRTKPLSKTAKAKAAFIRKLGACDDCRKRRVGCTREHWDLHLFEEEWRKSHGPLPVEEELKPVPPVDYFKDEWQIGRGLPPEAPKPAPAPELEANNSYQPRYSEHDDLAGVGGQVAYPSRGVLGAVEEEIDMLQDMQRWEFQDPLEMLIEFSENYLEPDSGIDFNCTDLSQPPPTQFPNPEPEDTTWLRVTDYQHIPICKQMSIFTGEQLFECLGTFAADPGIGEFPCGQCFDTLELLIEHFINVHYVFETHEERGKCLNCGLDWDMMNSEELTEPCKQCGRSVHEKWYWGFVSKAKSPSLTSGTTSVRVTSQDGYGFGMPQGGSLFADQSTAHYGQDNGGGFDFGGGFFFGDYPYGNGGSQYYKCGQDGTKHHCKPFANPSRKTVPVFGSNPAFSALVAFSLLSVVVTHEYLAAGTPCQAASPLTILSLSCIPELSIACIAAGFVAAWFFRHAVGYQREQLLYDALNHARTGALENSVRAAVAA